MPSGIGLSLGRLARRRVWRGGLALIVALVSCGHVWALEPSHPDVQKLLSTGLTFLENGPKEKYATSFGGKCLLGLAVWKHTHDANHPLVKAGLAAALEECARGDQVGNSDPKRMYSISVACMLLCELDSAKYARQIQLIIDALVKSQKGHGGFGYASHEEGDTSQVQYVILAFWAASHHGANVPDAPVERALNWLLRTQDINGSFAYMPKDPGNFTRIQHRPGSLSCAVAGLGSVIIAADLLGLEDPKAARNREVGDRAGSVRLVKTSSPTTSSREPTKNVNLPMVLKSIDQAANYLRVNGSNYLRVNGSTPDEPYWTFYYMYGYERYQSFWEKFNGLNFAEPPWYEAGVQYLKQKQNKDGSWHHPGGYHGAACDTALAMMYLVRSSKQMIHEPMDGVLLGGTGLPGEVSNLTTTADGRIVKPELFKSMDGLLALLDSDDPAMSSIGQLKAIELAQNPQERAAQVARLRRLAESGSEQARQLALQALGRTSDFENIPWLIYGLSDPDDACRQEALAGLCFLTRKFQGLGGSQPSTLEDFLDVREQWKAWYKTLRPDVEFLEE